MDFLQQGEAETALEKMELSIFKKKSSKACLHRRNVTLCIWWLFEKGVLYYEILQKNQEAIDVTCPEFANWKGIVFYHDNTRHHVSLQTRQKLFKLGCSSAPTDYHLFRPNNGKKFSSLGNCQNDLDKFITLKMPSSGRIVS